MQITKDITVLRIEINGSDIGLDGLTNIIPPTYEGSYWEFIFNNGHRVQATGNVTVDFRKQ